MAAPERQCRVCRGRQPKAGLQRWIRTAAGLERDDRQERPGRGFYTCSAKCAELLPQVIKKTGR